MSDETRECDCTEALEHLCEFVDLELDEVDLRRLQAHIENCPECRRALSNEQSIRVLLRRSCLEVAPDSLRLKVISQITVLRTSLR